MSTQYRDGSFGETLPLNDAVKVFNEALEAGTAKAFHVGTPEEIEEVKTMADFQSQLDGYSDRLQDIEAESNSVIIKPSHGEIEKLSI